MEFTGERFTPDCVREIWYEHWHRYVFASPLVAGKEVLDLACGEGYGSDLLARHARQVVGVDVAAEAIDHARQKYGGRDNLRFERGDATEIPLQDDAVDAVVSFETIEHLAGQAEMLAEFRRVLRPDGLLVISSPDRRVYSEQAGFENEFHVRELYKEEFLDLLKTRFPAVRLLGQKLLFQSAIWEEGAEPGSSHLDAWAADGTVDGRKAYEPVYWIALCADRPDILDSIERGTWWFGDAEESVYAHYYHEIRKNMQAGALIAERDEEIRQLKEQLDASAPSQGWWARLLARLTR